MDIRLSDLVDQERIAALDALPVPAPPGGPYPGEHLYVNCHYALGMAGKPPHECLEEARGDAVEILRRIAESSCRQNHVAVVVTVYGHLPVPGSARPARRRIYRAGIPGSDIPSDGKLITPEFLSRSPVEESSELDDIAELLHQPAH